jgi:hypothetical protein
MAGVPEALNFEIRHSAGRKTFLRLSAKSWIPRKITCVPAKRSTSDEFGDDRFAQNR